jgi:hypothetical protein
VRHTLANQPNAAVNSLALLFNNREVLGSVLWSGTRYVTDVFLCFTKSFEDGVGIVLKVGHDHFILHHSVTPSRTVLE